MSTREKSGGDEPPARYGNETPRERKWGYARSGDLAPMENVWAMVRKDLQKAVAKSRKWANGARRTKARSRRVRGRQTPSERTRRHGAQRGR